MQLHIRARLREPPSKLRDISQLWVISQWQRQEEAQPALTGSSPLQTDPRSPLFQLYMYVCM